MFVITAFRKCKNRVFVSGFVLGFIIALVCHQPERLSNVRGSCRPQTSKERSYDEWFSHKGIERKFVDIDSLVYGDSKYVTEAQFLEREVKITCVVLVNKVKNAKAIKDTWGRHCSNLEYFGTIRNDSIPINLIQPKNSFHLLCESINYVVKKYHSLQWTLFVHDDTFVVPENLRHFLAPLNYNIPYYLGHAQVFWGQMYNVAEAGYVLSKAALLAVQMKFNSTKKCIEGGKYWKNEDFYLGKHLADMGIVPKDTRDSIGRSRFHGYSLNQLLFSGQLSKLTSNWKRSVYPYIEGFGCCSDKAVTFRGVEADKFHQIKYLLRQVKVFTQPGFLGNQPAPTPMPEEQVWQDFLRAEGKENATVTAEEYFQLWKNKISGPDTFNERLRQEELGPLEATAVTFAHMPHVLESMLSAMHTNDSNL